MKRIAIILEEGFEEIEALTPKDILNRAGFECDLISTKTNNVTGAHNIKVETKIVNKFDKYDMIILPGGMPGAKNLSENEVVIKEIKEFMNLNKFIAAICAAPALVLSKADIITGKNVTCYPGMESLLKGANFRKDLVVKDKNLITSRGPGTAMLFAFELVDVLNGETKKLKKEMLFK